MFLLSEPETSAPAKSGGNKTSKPPSSPGNTPEGALLLGLSWWVWLAIGVGCLVVVLLMVFVIVMCKRIKRRKVSQDNKPGNLLMLLCRLRLFVWVKEDVLLAVFFCSRENFKR